MKVVLAMTAMVCVVAACDDDPDDPKPKFPPPAAGELVTVEPGGETVCSRGTPYRFFAFGGDPKRLVIAFEGGGACWSPPTCSVAEAIFAEEASVTEDMTNLRDHPDLGGIYRLDDAANPVQGWSLIHVPYCTGDVHWGDATHEYTETNTIHHRGSVNTRAVLDWMADRYPAPDTILVTGCSAGAYGAIGYASWVAERWPKADVRVLADSGAGIITDSFFEDSFPNWNALPTLQAYLPELAEVDLAQLSIEDLYIETAKAFPNMRIGEYNTAFDKDQTLYYTVMGGGDDWSDRMRATVSTIAGAAPNFRHYLAPGQVHCILPYRFFYERESGPAGAEMDFVTWLDEFINGRDLPPSIVCDGERCLQDSVCQTCAASDNPTTGAICRWCDGWPPEE